MEKIIELLWQKSPEQLKALCDHLEAMQKAMGLAKILHEAGVMPLNAVVSDYLKTGFIPANLDLPPKKQEEPAIKARTIASVMHMSFTKEPEMNAKMIKILNDLNGFSAEEAGAILDTAKRNLGKYSIVKP